MHVFLFQVALLPLWHTIGMGTSAVKDFGKADMHEGRKIHRLRRELERGMLPFMMNEVGELTEKNKLFVAVCEAVVKSEAQGR